MGYRMMGADDAPVAEWKHIYPTAHRRVARIVTIADGEMAAWTAKGVHL